MDTPPVIENIWRQIAEQLVVQVDAVLEPGGVVLTVHLRDDSAVAVFINLPAQVRTERGAQTVAAWIYRGLIFDVEDSGAVLN